MKVARGICFLFVTAMLPMAVQAAPKGVQGCFGGAPKMSFMSRFTDPSAPEVHAVFDKVVSVLQDFGAEHINFEVDYNEMEFNAYAYKSMTGRNVVLNVGLLLDEESSEDTVALVACHETGHHFGGEPTTFGGLSVEGQADYYASQKCFDNWVRVSGYHVTPSSTATEYCSRVLHRTDEACARTHEATIRLGKVASRLGSEGTDPSLDGKDTNAVSVTYTGHPKAQCRVDTYKAGFMCLLDSSCPDKTELRPKCWYAKGI